MGKEIIAYHSAVQRSNLSLNPAIYSSIPQSIPQSRNLSLNPAIYPSIPAIQSIKSNTVLHSALTSSQLPPCSGSEICHFVYLAERNIQGQQLLPKITVSNCSCQLRLEQLISDSCTHYTSKIQLKYSCITQSVYNFKHNWQIYTI